MSDETQAGSACNDELGITRYYGVYFSKPDSGSDFWKIKCSCGVTVTYPVNGLPEVDTPHPCGDPNHWAVKIGKANA